MGSGVQNVRQLVVVPVHVGGFDLAKAEKGHWRGREYFMPLSHGRKYTKEE